MSRRRIAIASIFTESNHFSGGFTEYEDFAATELLRGEAILAGAEGAVRGMLNVCGVAGCEILPLLVASAYPGPTISLSCYSTLKEELLDRLRNSGPIDGVLLAMHGAAAVAEIGDLEGDLLVAVRNIVGSEVAISASLDMHGHVTPAMIANADIVVAWETYPHRDTLETGERAARLLLRILDGEIRPAMAIAKIPLLATGIHGSTEGDGPLARLMRTAKGLEGEGRIVSTALFQVHSYLDFPDLGATALVIADRDMDLAESTAAELANQFWKVREEFEVDVLFPREAIERGTSIPKRPILLVETADCVGGGAAGDSVATLKALLQARVTELSLVPVVDPVSAEQCHQAGEGTRVRLQLGHGIDPCWGAPLDVEVEVVRLTDGKFVYSGGVWQGKHASMGSTALVRIGAIRVLIASRGTYDWADEQFASVGLRAADAKFVVVKNPMNYRLAYQDIAKGAFVLDTPGPTPATVMHLPYKELRRPVYPLDSLDTATPVVIRGREVVLGSPPERSRRVGGGLSECHGDDSGTRLKRG